MNVDDLCLYTDAMHSTCAHPKICIWFKVIWFCCWSNFCFLKPKKQLGSSSSEAGPSQSNECFALDDDDDDDRNENVENLAQMKLTSSTVNRLGDIK